MRTGDVLEVDFLARYPAGGEKLIQVCADPSNPETIARELRALASATTHHPRAARRCRSARQDADSNSLPEGCGEA